MDIMDAILARRSIRKYSDIPIPKDVLVDMVIAGQYAPHAGNAHTCRIVIIDDEGIKDNLADACYSQTWMKSAPVYILIASDLQRIKSMYGERGETMYSNQNAAAIAQSMILIAQTHDLGTCWVGAFNKEKVAQIIGMPDNFEPQIILTVGYPGEKPVTPPKIDMVSFVFLNSWTHMNNVPMLFKDYADVLQSHLRRAATSLHKTGKKAKSDLGPVIKKHYHALKEKISKKK